MTTLSGDYLREARKWKLRDAADSDAQAAEIESTAASLRAKAVKLREQACQFGAGVQVLEGDDAKIDLPDGIAAPSMLEIK